MIARGAAVAAGLGNPADAADVPPELTITIDGAFWSPASPTILDGELDVGERLTHKIGRSIMRRVQCLIMLRR